MPNIMLTYRCNLNCPYCFANEFVNKKSNDITFDNFLSAVRFITKDGPAFLGLIGGEPTLHKDFKNILRVIIEDGKIKEIGKIGCVKCDRRINAERMIALPGLVNAHTHLSMGLMRNYKDSSPNLQEWLSEIFPIEDKLNGNDIYRLFGK